MTNLAIPSVGQFERRARRLPKPVLLGAMTLVVLALMALSFLVGGATIGSHGAAKPATQVTVQPAQPAQPAAGDRLLCHRHEQC